MSKGRTMTKNALGGSMVAFALACAPAAYAHPGHAAGVGLAAGFAHPFLGLDHLLAMVAVGLWAAQLEGRARFAVPAMFVTAMAVGAATAVGGIAPPAVELGIAVSVLVLGLLVAARARLALGASLMLIAAFAVLHGDAHGADLAQSASPLLFATGMLLATAALHAIGFAAGTACRAARNEARLRATGAAIALTGAFFWSLPALV